MIHQLVPRFLADLALPTVPPAVHSTSVPVTQSVTALADHILSILLAIAIPLAAIGIFITAYRMIISAGKPEAMANAKKYLGFMLIGIFLVVAAFVIVRLVISTLSNI